MIGIIKGTGSALPEKVMSNGDLEQIVETNDQWIRERTGVVNRRIIKDETTVTMAVKAAKLALENGNIESDTLDMIILATLSSNVIMPNTACMVQKEIGAKNAVCFDLNAACSGFIFAYNTAQAYIFAGQIKRALVIGVESLSTLVDWTDRGTCILFGDGAGAVVLESETGELPDVVMGANGGIGNALTCVSLRPEEVYGKEHYIQMNGQAVFKFALRQIPKSVEELLEKIEKDGEEIDYFILHQANKRIVESVAKRLKQPIEKFPMNLMEYGNTSSASIPILMDEMNRAGQLQPGMKLIMVGFGGGLTWGVTYLEWK